MKLVEPPDFDDMLSVAQQIGQLTKEVMELDIEIKDDEANVVSTVMTDANYFKDGKALAMNAIEATYKYRGLHGELIAKRMLLAQKKGDLESARLTFESMKGMIQVFQTQSSNLRGAIV